jgi:hypothetical protein
VIDSEALVTIEDLIPELPFTMDVDDTREATGALEDLSDDARYYGKSTWTTPEETPRQVRRLVLKAAKRHMKNYEGYLLSRAGDETVQFTDRGEGMGSAEFTGTEIAQLREYGGSQRSGFHSVNMFTATRRPTPSAVGLVPAQGGGYIRYFSDDTEPW